MYAMNPDVYTVSSQDFVESIATNLYGASGTGTYSCKLSGRCITYITVHQKASSKCNT